MRGTGIPIDGPAIFNTTSRLACCPRPCATSSSAVCNVVHGRVQRRPRPRTTKHIAFSDGNLRASMPSAALGEHFSLFLLIDGMISLCDYNAMPLAHHAGRKTDAVWQNTRKGGFCHTAFYINPLLITISYILCRRLFMRLHGIDLWDGCIKP